MGITFTRSEIRTRVDDKIRDSGNSKVTAAEKNRTIAEIHRDFVDRSECNRNTLIFSLASAAASGVVEYDKNGNTPTITKVDVEGYNYYQISGCDRIDKIERWITTGDGSGIALPLTNTANIEAYGSLDVDSSVPSGVEMLAPDTFRFLPPLSSDAYPIKIRVLYREAVTDLITNDAHPVDNTTPVFNSAGLNDLTNGSAGTAGATYTIKITGVGTPDSWAYSKNGAAYSANAIISAGAMTVADGLTITFAATTGHTLNDTWSIYVDDKRVPSIPLRFRKALVWGVLAELMEGNLGDDRAGVFRAKYERAVSMCKVQVMVDSADARPKVIARYRAR